MKINVVLIRHGKTLGNINHAYIGTTDEELSEVGIQELLDVIESGCYPQADYIYTSPLKRCIETANYSYPKQIKSIKNGLRECDFGDFEGKNYKQLSGNPDYQEYVDSGGMTGFPNGELPADFAKRCQDAFAEIISSHKDGETIGIVCHGGTIMAVLDKYSMPHEEFFSWQVKNAEGYQFIFDTELKVAIKIQKIQEEQS